MTITTAYKLSGERGELREWLGFFLTGVTEQAADAVTRAERLVDLREVYRLRLLGDRSRAVEVVDLVFQNPVLTRRASRKRSIPHSRARSTTSAGWKPKGSCAR